MANDEWETPLPLFNGLQKAGFNFTFDVCASDKNHLLDKYWTIKDDALSKDWCPNEFYWMNPPYSQPIAKFCKKVHDETLDKGIEAMVLIPNNLETKYYQRNCLDGEAVLAIYFIDSRLKYTLDGVPQGSPRFGSCLVWFRKNWTGQKRRIHFYRTDKEFSYVEEL